MRNGQTGIMDDRIAIQHDIQIERTRRIGKFAHAAVDALYRQQGFEQCMGFQRGVDQRHRIDEIRLIGITDRCTAIQRGPCRQPGAGQCRQRIESGLDLAQRISEWGPEGRYGWVFGEADEPVVDFTSHDVTAVDLTEILDLGTERTAILGYLFRRIEMLIEEKRPTLILIDEAWKVLDDEYFAKKLAEWLVTARKKNVVVVMMTQFPSQIRGSKARSILEALPNQFLFPNGEASSTDYDGFRLTDGELDFVLSPIPGQRMVLSRTPRSSTVLNVDLKALGPLLTALGGGQAGLNAFGADYAQRSNFWKE